MYTEIHGKASTQPVLQQKNSVQHVIAYIKLLHTLHSISANHHILYQAPMSIANAGIKHNASAVWLMTSCKNTILYGTCCCVIETALFSFSSSSGIDPGNKSGNINAIWSIRGINMRKNSSNSALLSSSYT